jgi:hypothetical protein
LFTINPTWAILGSQLKDLGVDGGDNKEINWEGVEWINLAQDKVKIARY